MEEAAEPQATRRDSGPGLQCIGHRCFYLHHGVLVDERALHNA
jgi:hypothetical protein